MHDSPGFPCRHVLGGYLGAKKGSLQIRTDHGIPVVIRQFEYISFCRSRWMDDAGIVDEIIDATEPARCLGHQAFDIGALRHRPWHHDAFAPGGFDLACYLFSVPPR